MGIRGGDEAKRVMEWDALLIQLENIPRVTVVCRTKCTSFSVAPKVLQHQGTEARSRTLSLASSLTSATY